MARLVEANPELRNRLFAASCLLAFALCNSILSIQPLGAQSTPDQQAPSPANLATSGIVGNRALIQKAIRALLSDLKSQLRAYRAGDILDLRKPINGRASSSAAASYAVLHSFSNPDGSEPQGSLIQASDGRFYGTTSGGGAFGQGAVLKMDSAGNLVLLHSFAGSGGSGPEGTDPVASLVEGADGNFYGTTSNSGPGGLGTIFKISQMGILTVLHSFSGPDGAGPAAPLIQGQDGFFYGTTALGGDLLCRAPGSALAAGCGTIFRTDSSGNFTSLHSFSRPEGVLPVAALVQASDGNFYGTTAGGGNAPEGGTAFGTVFRMDSSGDVTLLHSFVTFQGASPEGGVLQGAVIQGTDGNFYGTSSAGGNSTSSGTVFKMDLLGNVTVLHSFSGSEGASPAAPLIQAPDGNFYGTTSAGGTGQGTVGNLLCDCGTLFEMDSSGDITILHEFAGYPADGAVPYCAPVLGTDGNLYGTTKYGGMSNVGTIFQLSGFGTTTLPLLSISSTHSANFTQGQVGATYTVTVRNVASAGPTNGTVQVTDTLPAGLTLASMSGTGWNCVGNVCTRSDALEPNSSYPPITVSVDVASTAPSQVTNQVSVSGGGSAMAIASDSTTVMASAAGPSIPSGAVLNAAANLPGPVAPGSIAVAYGNFLLGSASSAQNTPWPTNLAGLSLQFGAAKAPLYYVSGSQVNFQVPWELAGNSEGALIPSVSDQTGAGQTVSLAPFAPGVFSTNSQGTGQGAIIDVSGKLIDSSNPAIAGTAVVEIYCTGLGPVGNQPTTGSPAPSSPLAQTITTPTVTIGGASAPVLFSGLAPGYVGLYQLNVQVPTAAPAGNAVPVVISIGGASSNAVTVAVQSALGSGSLQIQITGAPPGTTPSISITSAYQNGFSKVITTSQQFDVPAGAYTIVADAIPVGNTSYGAFPGQQTVYVAAGSMVSANVPYTVVIPQSTKTLDQQGIQSLAVSADGSTLTLPAASTVAQSLVAGNVLAVGATPSAPNGLLRKVVSVSQTGSQIVATTTQATLADAFQRANFTFATSLNGQSVQSARALRPGVKVSSRIRPRSDLFVPYANSGSLQLPCTSDTTILVEMLDTPIVEDSSGSITITGEIEVCPSLEFDWNIGGFPPQLNSLTATATLGEDAHVNITGTYDNSFQQQVSIATIATDPITVFVGPVPLVLTPTVTFFVGASGDVNAGFSFGVTQTASVTGGISYENGQVSPVFPAPTNTFATDPVGLDASLSAKGYVGFTLDVDVDGILSPEFSPDAFLSLDVNLLNNPWWTLSAGLEGSASVDVSIFGIANLANFSLPDLFQFSKPIAQASGGFLSSSGAPSLNAVSPNAAPAGSSSLTITLTGSNFVPGATVNFNGAAISSTYVSPNQITATLPATDLTGAGKFPLTVTNPGSSGGSSQPVNFTVQSAGGSQSPQLTGLTLSASSVVGGNVITGTVVLSGPAPAGGVQVALSSSSPNAIVAASVNVIAGQASASFTISTTAVSSSQSATITATISASSVTAVLTISPSENTPLTILSVTGNCGSQGELNYYSSFGVYWTQTSAYYNVDISIAVTTGFSSVPEDGSPVMAFLTNSFLSGTTVSNQIAQSSFVIPPGSAPGTLINVFSGLVLAPGQYFMTIYAPTQGNAGGWCVADNPTVTADTGVMEPYTYWLNGYSAYPPAGGFVNYWDNAQFSITGTSGVPPPSKETVKSLSLSPTSVAGAGSVTGIVTLSAAAPSGGVQVSLASNNANAQVPRSVIVAAGQISATLTITTVSVSTSQTATISASIGASTQTATLTITSASASLVGQDFTIDGTMNIGGQTIGMEIQALTVDGSSYLVAFLQTSNLYPVSLTFALNNVIPSGSGNTITFSGPVTAGLYTNGANIVTINSATLTLTVSGTMMGSTATGTFSFPSSGGTIQGTITGTLTDIGQ